MQLSLSTLFQRIGAIVAVILVTTAPVLAEAPTSVNADANGVVLKGYDPVAYFTEGQPVAGSSEYTATHNGGTYHFASAANRDAFNADPDKYAPQYGGYCAFGASKGKKVDIDPTAWRVVEDKLYVNYNAGAQRIWLRDIPGHIAEADTNWPRIKDIPADQL